MKEESEPGRHVGGGSRGMIGFDLHSQGITEAETGKPVRDYSNGAGRDDGGWDQGSVVGVRMCRL